MNNITDSKDFIHLSKLQSTKFHADPVSVVSKKATQGFI